MSTSSSIFPPGIHHTRQLQQQGFNRQKQRLFLGLLLSSLMGYLAYRRHSLSRSGIAGAMVTGTTTFGMGGVSWGLSLIFFFLSSSFFSRFREKEKTLTAIDKFSKGSQRDIAQVVANGGVATLLALVHGLSKSLRIRSLMEAGYVGAVATATADTWATELGVLSSQAPRLITTGKVTTPGTSGGITLPGTIAATLGALSSGLFFWLLRACHSTSRSFPLIALVSGLTGCMFDSFLGATVQAMYYCPVCQKETERQIHSCGTRTSPLRGLPWMNNDVVNFLATLFGSLVAIVLHLPIRRQKISL